MDHRRTIVAVSLAACLAAGSVGAALSADNSSSGGTKVYRWTDDKGVVHYGDSVPSEYSQRDRSVLNNQGVEVGHIEGGMNAAQQAEAARTAGIAQQRAQHDQFLLATYLSTKDIEQLRDERAGLVEAQIKAALIYIDTLNTRLGAMQERALRFKPYNSDASARRMPDELAEELVHTLNESRTQRQALDAKRHEVTELRAQFDSDIARYRELTARHN
ncbi:MAG TPA: DUF4124 domain-containing protein [Steroidobacteraceae bacterium]|jgi:hypothetical protein|nr:DUF4124 domain-containing protein [Steroidobacteraceae bacterium]